MDTILNLYKPPGITSNRALSILRKTWQEKKIGHLGTLDPLAEGVLPVFSGKYTKLIPYFNAEDKIYRVTIALGLTSDTLDTEGPITQVTIPANLSEKEVVQAVKSFEGTIDQTPPLYSAIKKNGIALYKLARRGETPARESRKVTLYWIKNIKINLPYIYFDVHCSKGTYIRSLADDIGKTLQTKAILHKLIRLSLGKKFTIKNSISLDQVQEIHQLQEVIVGLSPLDLLQDMHKISIQDEKEIDRVLQGQSIAISDELGNISDKKISKIPQTFLFNDKQRVVAIGRLVYSRDNIMIFQPHKVLL